MYPKEVPQNGNKNFDMFVGSCEDLISQEQVDSDLTILEDKTENIRKLVNKALAHFTKPVSIQTYPKYGELGESLKTIEGLLQKYNSLLMAHNISNTEKRYNRWMRVLQKPWIGPESSFYKELKNLKGVQTKNIGKVN